jgi:hypothetical protein
MHFGARYRADLRGHSSALRGGVSDVRREREKKARTDLLVTHENVESPPNEGLRAPGSSLELSGVLVPSAFLTVFVAAASNPDGAKLGFAL